MNLKFKQIIEQYKRDQTGPHGKGLGPGKGKGCKDEKDKIEEMPHADYDNKSEKDFKNKLIDFNIKKMPLNNKLKQKLTAEFWSKGIVGQYKHKYILFNPDMARFIKNKDVNKYSELPKEWVNYITIFDS